MTRRKNKIAEDDRPPIDPSVDLPEITKDEAEWMASKTPAEMGLSDDWRDYGWTGGKDIESFQLDEHVMKEISESQALGIVLRAIVDGNPADVIPRSKIPKGKSVEQVRVEQAKRLLTGENVTTRNPPKSSDWPRLGQIAELYFEAWLNLGEVSHDSMTKILEEVVLDGSDDPDYKTAQDRIRRYREAFNANKHRHLVEVTYPEEWMTQHQMLKITQILDLLKQLGIEAGELKSN